MLTTGCPKKEIAVNPRDFLFVIHSIVDKVVESQHKWTAYTHVFGG